MTEAEQTQLSAQTEADATLATPRFDATEAQVAQPVVPLAEVRRRRRTWPLLILSAILGGVVSVAGLYLYQRRVRTAGTQPPAEQQRPTPTASAPPETA